MEEHGRHAKSLEVRRRQRYGVSRSLCSNESSLHPTRPCAAGAWRLKPSEPRTSMIGLATLDVRRPKSNTIRILEIEPGTPFQAARLGTLPA